MASAQLPSKYRYGLIWGIVVPFVSRNRAGAVLPGRSRDSRTGPGDFDRPLGAVAREATAHVAVCACAAHTHAAMLLACLLRRVAYGAVTVLGVLLLLFVLFFLVTNPDDIARRALGEKAPPEAITQWKVNHGYDRPRFWDRAPPSDTMIFEHFRRMLTFNFGRSDADDVPITRRLREGLWPSLSLTLPLFLLELPLAIGIALLVAFLRETYVDRLGVTLCVLGMSISVLLYIVGGQYLLGKVLRWFPISGFDPRPSVILRFLALPVAIGMMAGLGEGVRFYRTVFVEEVG